MPLNNTGKKALDLRLRGDEKEKATAETKLNRRSRVLLAEPSDLKQLRQKALDARRQFSGMTDGDLGMIKRNGDAKETGWRTMVFMDKLAKTSLRRIKDDQSTFVQTG
ncbi:hypothetical protein [Lacimicrobium sp. SS2-24]|uniref:hypothetical protein n=1 Tax=Lacimicrobium sp. SS2-24 TaxID=2005569 RepID=UPI0014388D6E|nr:hypothetical protein [Lacimicrobium sp. SS2-24]